MEVPFLVAAAERRSVRRYVRLECEVVRERGFRLLGRRALDLSATGVRVVALDEAERGESVILTFRAPGTEAWIDAEGTVARVVRGRRASDHGPSLAIELGTPDAPHDATLRSVLVRALPKLPPALPRRSPRIDWASTVRRIADETAIA